MFIKRNPLPGSDSLQCEIRGLDLLRSHASDHGFRVPVVFSFDQDEIRMERIEAQAPASVHFRTFGEQLGRLHRIQGPYFGLDHAGFIGLNRQVNDPCSDWGEFFLNRRLRYQIDLVKDQKVKERLTGRLEKSKVRLIEFLNAHQPIPSLLHGDLWSGNFLFSNGGFYLIDPAVYYGDRECDLAMTKMFGGFPKEFYQQYEKTFPLSPGFDFRVRIYNCYHYLNHYNLFGDGYLAGVAEGFESFDRL